ncbi:hypothetical protein CVIRNUC_006136 [Coccomyxa viridis]|uniref:Uncharacterized protein n=1 Tax=Coccomyxa viridis TaxID=1274662 RepID=A0AAV1I6F8_9CHLO|nr:hypothetical protein CVIRNUC_006136 [Coccomyxa viridis]
MMEGAILRKGPVCSCSGRYIGRLTQLRQHLCCDMGRSAAGRRWHRRSMETCAGLHFGKSPSTQYMQGVQPAPALPLPALPYRTAWLLIGLQAFALVGCLVTGTLARRRRLEVEGLNNRLRQINTELMKRGTVEELVCSADAEKEAVQAYRQALEQALDQPAAAHPVESYGMDNMSLAQARRTLSGLLKQGKDALRQQDPDEAVLAAKQALSISRELTDTRAERAVLRLLARGYRARGSLQASLDALHKSLGLSSDLEDSSGDVDVLGAIGDTYTELGDLEKAAEFYDKCIQAIQEDPASTSSTWDC